MKINNNPTCLVTNVQVNKLQIRSSTSNTGNTIKIETNNNKTKKQVQFLLPFSG